MYPDLHVAVTVCVTENDTQEKYSLQPEPLRHTVGADRFFVAQ